ncbi:type VII secretion protein EccCa [Pseudonocardia sp. WMMC193]|uniref:type VII secretion protein EccCa n=1 Tax=Pseudonocardia sp. WMMC193 TaxID=2911965 RepID=UPI001F02C186|nr:type VII secretion protein EccCa [Pseudonocardia sp. WMMC193]MCF7553148.1 type VII secretion protein EccCa [Pseudonocardia sp. WMMC193]
MGTIAVRRRRRDVPPVPSGELHLEPPPEPERAVPPGVLARVLPVAMLLGSAGIVAVMGVQHPTSWVFGGMFAMSSVGMLMGGGTARGAERTASLDEDRRDYLRYLAGLRRRARAVAATQRRAVEHVHPPVTAWPEVLAAGRLWERDPEDDDFAHVRIGLGPQRLATPLVAPRTGPVDGVEPVAAQAVRRLLAHHSVVPGLPVAVDLRAPVWLDGPPEQARAVARALVVGFALWHSPADARVAVLGDSTWDWVKWLPHTAHAVEQDALGPVRMLTGDPDVLRRWWAADPEPRQLLVVVDGPEGPGAWAAADGVGVLRVGVAAGRREGPSVVRVRLADPAPVETLDALTADEALAAARRLARYRPEGAERRPGNTAHGLLDLLGLPGPGPAGVAALRARRSAADRMRVPLGVDDAGRPLLLDLKESALGGSGPHGLCVGATGSGKSELLRALVVGLVLAHGPDELNLVLVDFKGGATFLGLTGLPHVSAVITNLADELTLVDRMADAVSGEITRRQELLRAAGNLAGIAEYEAARLADPGLAPLPVLMIVVDEFSELVARRPELVDLFVTVGRLGRSLGLHLLLASQRLDEGRLRGLESHLSYRIALRTFSASESRAVLGVPDAHALPPTPGSAILAAGTDQLVRFRGAFVSGGTRRVRAGARRIHRFTAAPVAAPAPREEAVEDSVLTTAVAAVTALGGPAAHRVWLPPLDVSPALADLPVGSGLRVAVGLVDRPARQRRDPLVVDLAGPAGHVAVAGGPRSGKSTALATLVRAFARAHDPTELGVHVLDLGGGALAALEDLPHVGTVAGRAEPDRVRRVLAEVAGVLARREGLFRAEGIGSVAQFRARRAAGESFGEPATDVLLVVDGLAASTADWAGGWAAADEAAGWIAAIAHRGLAYGVHLAVSVSRWGELRPAVRDQLGLRLELRLGEPGDSDVDRRRAAAVPARPGHGLAPDGDTMVLAHGTAPVAPGPAFPPVRVLPARIAADALPPDAIGVDEAGDPVPLGAGHLLCLGDPGSGKTGLLRLVADRVARTDARIVAIDPRRALLGALPADHVLEHAVTPTAIAAAVGDLVASLTRRRPGPEVTAERLRARDWWSGPEVWVLVDDHDLAVPPGAAANPLAPLAELLADGADLGLHVVLARRVAGASRALFDPVLGRLRELGGPAIVLHGSPDEGPLVGSVRASAQPPGRGVWVDRAGTRPVQLGWREP